MNSTCQSCAETFARIEHLEFQNAALAAQVEGFRAALQDAESRMSSQLILLKCDDPVIKHETATVRNALAQPPAASLAQHDAELLEGFAQEKEKLPHTQVSIAWLVNLLREDAARIRAEAGGDGV